MVKCLECLKDFENENSLHKHLKSHKLSVAFYYQKFVPKYDKHTGELIKFKSKDFYFNNEFNSRANLQKWLIKADVEERKKYIIDFLRNRRERKRLVYAPMQAELKTLACPGIAYINELFSDYYSLVKSLGFVNKFSQYSLNRDLFKDISSKVIFADKREQKRLDFDLVTRNKSMNFGDYRMAGSDIYVERKSVADLWQSLTTGYDRICREIERADSSGCYLIIVVEENLKEMYNYPYRWQVRGRIKMSPEIPLHNMREICQKYPNTQFLFLENRGTASKAIETIFSAGYQCKITDLQLCHDQKLLI